MGSGVTGNTSAKVTALQSTMLGTIVSWHGTEAAEIYAAASAAAVQDVADFVAEETIGCELERRPAVTYAATYDELEAVAGEFDAAVAVGLPVEWNDRDGGLPYPVAGGLVARSDWVSAGAVCARFGTGARARRRAGVRILARAVGTGWLPV